MSAKLTLVIDAATEDVASFNRLFDRGNGKKSLTNIIHHLRGILGGIRRARVLAWVSTAFASATCTIVNASVAENDTVVPGGVTFTARTTGATSVQFNIGATATETAANLVAAVNAHATAQKLVKASNVAGVVTFQAVTPGTVGNFISLTKTGTGFTLSGTVLAGGLSEEVDSYSFGHH